jgi:hypothetical protein
MLLIFKEKYISGTDTGDSDYYSILNGVDADIFFARGDIPYKFRDCFDVIGGFTDRCFFVKSAIKNLSEADRIELVKYIKKINKEWVNTP